MALLTVKMRNQKSGPTNDSAGLLGVFGVALGRLGRENPKGASLYVIPSESTGNRLLQELTVSVNVLFRLFATEIVRAAGW